ncbi:hypothetical protein HDU85_003835 [Gaertneriomyces sp. JEL0708]|nr:hypothetical protein HDU85_003835 [Gaertneriomyces sp. JEL0708]
MTPNAISLSTEPLLPLLTAALVTYCELHGPAFCVVTQPSDHKPDADCLFESHDGEAHSLPTTIQNQSNQSTSCSGCTISFGSRGVAESHSELGEPKGCMSWDSESRTAYISGHHPYHAASYSIVRQACVQSLSCEFCPGREGPILFGDDSTGGVLSYMFKIRDSQARGYQRWYSILFISSDRSFLVASWPFLVSKFRAITAEMQTKAEVTFMREKSAMEAAESGLHRQGAFNPSTPTHFLRRRGHQALRLLADIVNMPDLGLKLHLGLAWSLKAYTTRVRLLKPPVTSGVHLPIGAKDSVFSAGKATHAGVVRLLGTNAFITAFGGAAIGHQLVIRGSDKNAISCLLLFIKSLLPPHGWPMCKFSDQYDSTLLLGMPALAAVTPVAGTQDVVILDITLAGELAGHGNGPSALSNGTLHASVTLDSAVAAQVEQCGFVQEISALLQVHAGADIVDAQLANCTKVWQSKAALFGRFKRSVCANDSVSLGKFLRSIRAKQTDLPLLSCWSRHV